MNRFRLIVLLLLLPPALAAQHARFAAPMPDVLSPEPRVSWIGLIGGANLNTHDGAFETSCAECRFSDGSGSAAMFGVEYGRRFNAPIGFAVKLLYDDKTADYTTVLNGGMRMTVEEGTGIIEYRPLNVERSSTVFLSYATLNPMLQLYPLKHLYLMAGPAVGFKLRAQYNERERLMDEGYTFVETGTRERTAISEDSADVPEAASMRLDLRAGIGYNLALSERVAFSPEVIYELPLSSIAESDSWKASTLHLSAVLKIYLF
jgi:hypothetical protein